MRRGALTLLWILFFSTFLAPPIRGESMRTLNLGIAVSKRFKINKEWKRIFEKRLAYSSQIFEREFKIKFNVLRYWDWETEAERQDMTYLIEDLMSRYPLDEVDAVIGLTRYVPSFTLDSTRTAPRLKDLHILGRTRAFSGYVVVRYPETQLYRVQEESILTHELGHLFGAVHINNPDTIMAANVSKHIPTKFDDANREIVRLTRDINFQKGLDAVSKSTIQEFINFYKRLIQNNQTFGFFVELGSYYLSLGQPRDALEAWKAALDMEPKHARTLYNMGMLYYKMGRSDEAIRSLVDAVAQFKLPSQDRSKASAFHVLGNAYYENGDYNSAYTYWNRSRGLLENNIDNDLNLSILQLKRGYEDQALRAFDEILSQDPNNVKALSSRGATLFLLGDYTESIRSLNSALSLAGPQRRKGVLTELNGEEPSEIKRRLGTVYLSAGNAEGAIGHLKASVELNPRPETQLLLGKAYFTQHQWRECAGALAGLKTVIPDNPDLYRYLGACFSQLGAKEEAIFLFEEGLKNITDADTQAEYHRRLGDLYRDGRAWESAIRAYEKALGRKWSDKDTHFGLAQIYLATNRMDEARKSLGNILTIDPFDQKAKDTLSKLR